MPERRDAVAIFLATLAGAWSVIAGLAFYVPVTGFVVLALIGLGFRESARTRLTTRPDAAIASMQRAVIFPFAVIAATTALTAFVGLHLSEWIALLPDWAIDRARLTTDDGKPSEAAKSATSLVTGAITGLVAFLWSDSAKERESTYWPVGLAKSAFKKAFADHVTAYPQTPDKIGDYTQLFDAVHSEEVTDEISGWDAEALAGRIGIIRKLCPKAFPQA